MGRSILGQEAVVERLLLTLLCNGNLSPAGVPSGTPELQHTSP